MLFVSSLINMFIFLLPTPNFILASYSFVRSPSSCFLSVSVFRLPGMFRERLWARTQKMTRMARKDQGSMQCSNQPFPSIHFISARENRDNRAVFTFSTCWCRCSELQDLRALPWPQLAAVAPCSLGGQRYCNAASNQPWWKSLYRNNYKGFWNDCLEKEQLSLYPLAAMLVQISLLFRKL